MVGRSPMDETEFVHLISSLQSKRPLRVTYVANKILGSLEWKPVDDGWTHLMSIPRGRIYKFRHPNYKHPTLPVAHQGLFGVYRKLVSMGFISHTDKYKFLS